MINDVCTFRRNGSSLSSDLLDGIESTYRTYSSAEFTVASEEEIGGIYIKFDRTPPAWKLTVGEEVIECGKYGFLHEYTALPEGSKEARLVFDKEVSVCDFYVLSTGETLPSFVQVWRPAEGPCDVMLLACHSDDDQLFFAGSVPDAVARGAEMQVCYFTNHWNRHTRPHELLNGLWVCGLDRYPVVGDFLDSKKGMTEEEGLKIFGELGITYDDMVRAQTRLLRKYKPQIVLVHDINGEYGHSAHRLDSHSLRDAAMISADPSVYPDLAEEFGVWDVPKIYIHLYDKNQIEFEIDTPLERFGGRTAYQVSQDAFRCHISQFNSRYRDWLIGTEDTPVTKSTEFPLYSPRYYGLWKSTVGRDVNKTDFYEHIVFYADQTPDVPTPTPDTPTAEPSPVTLTQGETTAAERTPDPSPTPTPIVPSETQFRPSETQTEVSSPTESPTPAPTAETHDTSQEDPPENRKETFIFIGVAALVTAALLTVCVFVVLKIRTRKKP
ncbi:MAG: PIG-L family deacetylase [Clostridia bacterium]|nr:PIG-L family deacetylase [Clostridia bacterium]